MSSRVNYFKKTKINNPVVIVAPYGKTHLNTHLICETIVNSLNCSGIINYGWEPDLNFNYFKDKADCFNLKHIQEDVIKQEFYNPILESYYSLIQNNKIPFIFIISEISNSVLKKYNNKNLELLISSGSYKNKTCNDFYKFIFMEKAIKFGFNTFYCSNELEPWSDSDPNCLTQILNTQNTAQYFTDCLNCVHIRICEKLKDDLTKSIQTAHQIANCIKYVAAARNDPFGVYPINTNNYKSF